MVVQDVSDQPPLVPVNAIVKFYQSVLSRIQILLLPHLLTAEIVKLFVNLLDRQFLLVFQVLLVKNDCALHLINFLLDFILLLHSCFRLEHRLESFQPLLLLVNFFKVVMNLQFIHKARVLKMISFRHQRKVVLNLSMQVLLHRPENSCQVFILLADLKHTNFISLLV